MRVFRLTEDSYYNEFSQAYDAAAAPPAAKTTVANNALKISAATGSGEMGFEMGSDAPAGLLEELAKKLTAKTSDLKEVVEAYIIAAVSADWQSS